MNQYSLDQPAYYSKVILHPLLVVLIIHNTFETVRVRATYNHTISLTGNVALGHREKFIYHFLGNSHVSVIALYFNLALHLTVYPLVRFASLLKVSLMIRVKLYCTRTICLTAK